MGTAVELEESSIIRSRVAAEEPAYDVVERHFGFEVRAYPACVQARTTVRGGYRENLADGYRVLSGYMLGGNRGADGAPVTLEVTAPICHVDRDTVSVVSIPIPAAWKREALPRPVDPRVALVPVPAQRWAALTFLGRATPEIVTGQKELLRQAVLAAGLTPNGEMILAQYDPPWALSATRRNEVLVPVA